MISARVCVLCDGTWRLMRFGDLRSRYNSRVEYCAIAGQLSLCLGVSSCRVVVTSCCWSTGAGGLGLSRSPCVLLPHVEQTCLKRQASRWHAPLLNHGRSGGRGWVLGLERGGFGACPQGYTFVCLQLRRWKWANLFGRREKDLQDSSRGTLPRSRSHSQAQTPFARSEPADPGSTGADRSAARRSQPVRARTATTEFSTHTCANR